MSQRSVFSVVNTWCYFIIGCFCSRVAGLMSGWAEEWLFCYAMLCYVSCHITKCTLGLLCPSHTCLYLTHCNILFYDPSFIFLPSFISESGAVKRLVREGEEELVQKEHPDPYINPHMPGGKLYFSSAIVNHLTWLDLTWYDFDVQLMWLNNEMACEWMICTSLRCMISMVIWSNNTPHDVMW